MNNITYIKIPASIADAIVKFVIVNNKLGMIELLFLIV